MHLGDENPRMHCSKFFEIMYTRGWSERNFLLQGSSLGIGTEP